MYEASGNNPDIVTIERDEKMIELAKINLKKFNLQDKIKIEEGDCLEVLEKLQEPFDLIFMDAGKGHYNHFLPHCLRLLKEDGIIIADNVLFRGMVASKELVKRRKITIVKRMKRFKKNNVNFRRQLQSMTLSVCASFKLSLPNLLWSWKQKYTRNV